MVSTVERWSVALTVKLQAGSAKKSTCDYVSRRMKVELSNNEESKNLGIRVKVSLLYVSTTKSSSNCLNCP